jgi:hypothetical protein
MVGFFKFHFVLNCKINDSLDLSIVKEVATGQGSVWFDVALSRPHVMVKVCTVLTLKCCYHAGSEQTFSDHRTENFVII